MTDGLKTETFSPRVAVIGCGAWGKNLIRNFAELGALVALCDRDTQRANNFALDYNVPVLSEEEVFAHSAIDAVAIATHAPFHESQAEAALKAGKHVYLEKPMALSVEAAKKLCSLAKEKSLVLMVGHILNYHPAMITLKNRLEELGPLKHIYANRLGLGRFRHQESVLWDLASHDISLILALAQDMPEDVNATGQVYFTPQKPASALLNMSFSSGLSAHIHASWLSPFKEQKLVVVGEKAIAVFDDRKPWAEKLQISSKCLRWQDGCLQANEAFQTENVVLQENEPLQSECLHFVTCIEKGLEPLTSGEEGLRVTEVLEKAEHSLQTQEKQ